MKRVSALFYWMYVNKLSSRSKTCCSKVYVMSPEKFNVGKHWQHRSSVTAQFAAEELEQTSIDGSVKRRAVVFSACTET